MKRLSAVINKAESFIRTGEVRRAVHLLQQVDTGTVPLRFCAPLANLTRRCGMFAEALRLSQRAVRKSKPGDPIYTLPLAEYCTILIRLGSVEEAGRKLATISSSKEPAVLIARFWFHFTRYEYAESIPILESWLHTLKDPYLKMIAQNNLAEAYFGTGRYAKARLLVSESIEVCESKGYLRLLANGLHIRARCFTELNDLSRSNENLEQALRILKSTETGDALLIQRQLAINEALTLSSCGPIRKFKALAQRAGLWESLRELDFQSLRIEFKKDIFEKLYHGTPYPAFKRRIVKAYPEVQIKPAYVWGPKNVRRFDLANGDMMPAEAGYVRPKALTLLTLRALLQDHYRPLRTREIYAALFPNEEFQTGRSEDRVHQCIARLRRWLREERLPLVIERHERGYRLRHEARPTIALCIPEQMPAQQRAREPIGFVEALHEIFGTGKEFTAKYVRSKLGLSSATTIRRLSTAVKNAKLSRAGSGKSTSYRS